MIDAATLELATALAEGASEVVAIVEADGTPRVLNPRVLTALLGHAELKLTPAALGGLVHPQDLERVRAGCSEAARQFDVTQTLRFRARHADGRYLLLQCTVVRHARSGRLGAQWLTHTRALPQPELMDEVSAADSKRVRDAASFARALGDAVKQKLERVWQAGRFAATASKDRRSDYTLLLVELDRFKMIIGSHGQHVAEVVVSEVSERLRAVLGRNDICAHLGGGEFGVLLQGTGDAEQATRFADRIQDVVGESMNAGDTRVSTSAVIGIATSDRRYERAEDVMSDAAAALNRARRQQRKRRRAAFDTQIRLEDQQYITLLTELHEALKKQQFFLEYQPIIDFRSGKLAGFEALVRWQHPERGIVGPVHFIPAAEQTGFIVDLGPWVLREACRQMAVWQKEHATARGLTMSVNISAEQLGEDLLGLIESCLRDSGLGPERLRLEVTESAVLKNSDASARALAMLRLYGVGLSLDDFGTGYASFSYLHQLPYDTLKIDRSFVSRLGSGGKNDDVNQADIVAAMINLAHALKLAVVAEGVETVEQSEILQSLGCDHAQGYLFARPLGVAAASALLASDPCW